MSLFNKIKQVVQTEGARGIRHALQKEGTKRLAQDLSLNLDVQGLSFSEVSLLFGCENNSSKKKIVI
jgi:hypothetical protein